MLKLLVSLLCVVSLLPAMTESEARFLPNPPVSESTLVRLAPDADPEDVLPPGYRGLGNGWYRLAEIEVSRLAEHVSSEVFGAIEVVEPEVYFELQQVNDPELPNQWNLDSSGSPYAWLETGGSSTTVAILDSGLALVPDLACRTIVAPHRARAEIDPVPDDVSDTDGHGTWIAGVIGACVDNGVGIAGIAWDASIMPIKVCEEYPTGTFCLSSLIALGLDWAVAHGADVINMSFGSVFPSTIVSERIQAAKDAGLLLVAAAGNDGVETISFPARESGVLAIGSHGIDRSGSSFSNTGPEVDLLAPGEDIPAPTIGEFCDSPASEVVCSVDGTSGAAAHVSGAIALLMSRYPMLNASDLEALILDGAIDIDSEGWDTISGRGLLDVGRSFVLMEVGGMNGFREGEMILPGVAFMSHEMRESNGCVYSGDGDTVVGSAAFDIPRDADLLGLVVSFAPGEGTGAGSLTVVNNDLSGGASSSLATLEYDLSDPPGVPNLRSVYLSDPAALSSGDHSYPTLQLETSGDAGVCGVKLVFGRPATGRALVYNSIDPCVVMDSRVEQGGTGSFGLSETRHFQVTGASTGADSSVKCGIPDWIRVHTMSMSPAQAVSMSVHAISPTSSGSLKIWPVNGASPFEGGVAAYAADVLAESTSSILANRRLCPDPDADGACLSRADLAISASNTDVRFVVTGFFSEWPLGLR